MPRLLFVLLLCSQALPAEVPVVHRIQPALLAPVTVALDSYGIPHITAQNDHDLFFVQGYLTAKDRLFQMDYFRRRAEGKMAEILGSGAIPEDYQARLIGFQDQAEAIYKKLARKQQALLQAYADGVNAFIQEHRQSLPSPFQKLHYTPDPWQPKDSLVFGRVMSWRLSESLGEEIELARLFKDLGPSILMTLRRLHPALPITISSAQKLQGALPSAFPQKSEKLLALLGRLNRHLAFFSQVAGSNNWVVAPQKSSSGAPLLANDPHLSLDIPSIWHEVHLTSPGLNAIGTTFPGVPGIIVGHNEHIAWGVTTVGYDVLDLYLEKKDPQRKGHILFRGKSEPVQTREITIRYREGEKLRTKKMRLRKTLHGPVLLDLGNHFLTFRWTGQKPTFEVLAFWKILHAQNLADFRKALLDFRVGAQNFVYADTAGNIFWQATGEVPIRPKGCIPYLPMDGSSGHCEWQGAIPYEKLPHLLNPPQGFIATANNRPVDKRYPYYIGLLFDAGFRAARITERLKEKPKISFRDMQDIQFDNLSLPGKKVTPLILRALADAPLEGSCAQAAEFLKKWDDHTGRESVGSTIFHKTLQQAAILSLKDDLGKYFEELGGRSELILGLLLRAPAADPLYDDKTTPQKETRDDILRLSFHRACQALQKELGKDPAQWTWGRLHQLTLDFPLLKEQSIGPLPLPGAIHTVNAASFGLLSNFHFGGGPSLRFVAELKGKVEHAENVLPGGESEDPTSPHFQDQLPLWTKGRAHPMFFSSKSVARATQKVLTFAPRE